MSSVGPFDTTSIKIENGPVDEQAEADDCDLMEPVFGLGEKALAHQPSPPRIRTFSLSNPRKYVPIYVTLHLAWLG